MLDSEQIIINQARKIDSIIDYNTVVALLGTPPSLDPRPNFVNLHELRMHVARVLKKLPCPQSAVNGWSGAVMSPPMYALIDGTPFNFNIAPATDVPYFPPIYEADGITLIPYKREQTLSITANFKRAKNYNDTWTNIFRAVYDTHDAHVHDAFKVAPTTVSATVGWNSTMSLNNIFDQLMTPYGKPTPDAMRQNNLNFLAPYNPQDPPEILFKRCTDCQEIAIIAKVPYTAEQLLMNVINLLQRCGIYTRDLEDWDQKPDADKTWILIRPFIQAAYQRQLQLGQTTAVMSGYASKNRYAGLMTDKEISGDNTVETIAGTINTHMANLSAQTAASIEANAAQFNVLIQQLAAHGTHLQQQQQAMMQQMALLTMAPQQQRAPARTAQATIPKVIPQAIPNALVPQYPPIMQQQHQYQQNYQQPRGGRYEGQASARGGYNGRGRNGGYGRGAVDVDMADTITYPCCMLEEIR